MESDSSDFCILQSDFILRKEVFLAVTFLKIKILISPLKESSKGIAFTNHLEYERKGKSVHYGREISLKNNFH